MQLFAIQKQKVFTFENIKSVKNKFTIMLPLKGNDGRRLCAKSAI